MEFMCKCMHGQRWDNVCLEWVWVDYKKRKSKREREHRRSTPHKRTFILSTNAHRRTATHSFHFWVQRTAYTYMYDQLPTENHILFAPLSIFLDDCLRLWYAFCPWRIIHFASSVFAMGWIVIRFELHWHHNTTHHNARACPLLVISLCCCWYHLLLLLLLLFVVECVFKSIFSGWCCRLPISL